VLLVYLLPVFELQFDADDVNVLGGSVHSIRKNTETLVVASKKTGLEVKLSILSCRNIRMQDEGTI
jgi:hypothetical protein